MFIRGLSGIENGLKLINVRARADGDEYGSSSQPRSDKLWDDILPACIRFSHGNGIPGSLYELPSLVLQVRSAATMPPGLRNEK